MLGTVPSGPGQPSGPDGELLEAAAAIAAIDRQTAAWELTDKSVMDPDWQAELDDFWVFADRVRQVPARTPEGLQAKARVLHSVYQGVSGEMDHIGEHLHSLVRDMLGEG